MIRKFEIQTLYKEEKNDTILTNKKTIHSKTKLNKDKMLNKIAFTLAMINMMANAEAAANGGAPRAVADQVQKVGEYL